MDINLKIGYVGQAKNQPNTFLKKPPSQYKIILGPTHRMLGFWVDHQFLGHV